MKKIFSVIAVVLMAFAFACAPGGGGADVPGAPAAGAGGSIPSFSTFHSQYSNFGPHFASWLSSHGYSFGDGGFGGFRTNTGPSISKNVVVFIHGNSSRAHGGGSDTKGWYDTYEYLRNKGWNDSELYAVNYGYESMMQAAQNDHRSAFTNRVKNFINAVYAYTGRQVTIIAHSLGVTVSRKAMKDGNLYSKVKTFIAIAGGNHGLPTCGYVTWWGGYYPFYPILPTCSSSTGFYHAPQGNYYYGSTSNFIGKLNSSSYGDNEMEGKSTRTYVIQSMVDEIAGARASYTSKLAGAYKYKTYYSAPYGHFGAKNGSEYYQWKMVERTY